MAPSDDVINLRSDTQTLPTPTMLDAMASAPLGDDTYGEDPTVNHLEELAAARVGTEAALLVISGHMANLVALMVHGRSGDALLAEAGSHILTAEAGAPASVAGLWPIPLASPTGAPTAVEIDAAIMPPDVHRPRPRILALENTHNRAGGRVVPVAQFADACVAARAHGLSIHLDGARLFNAAVAAGVEPQAWVGHVDSVMFCLSKGLSCPLGSVVAGSRSFIAEARRVRKRIGGGMRQAGVFAAAGIVALETMVERLAEDHANARLLAHEVDALQGLTVTNQVDTNMVNVDAADCGFTTEKMLDALGGVGVLASGRPPSSIRLVTHRHITEADVRRAVERITSVVERAAAPVGGIAHE